MTKTTLKKKIVDCVENINDEKILEAVYTLLNGQVSNDEYELSSEDLKIINSRRKAVLKLARQLKIPCEEKEWAI